MRDLSVGSALTDVAIGMGLPLLTTGIAVSAADTKEKKRSVILETIRFFGLCSVNEKMSHKNNQLLILNSRCSLDVFQKAKPIGFAFGVPEKSVFIRISAVFICSFSDINVGNCRVL